MKVKIISTNGADADGFAEHTCGFCIETDIWQREIYEARQKYLHDEASMIEGAKSAGIAEGVKKGKEKLPRICWLWGWIMRLSLNQLDYLRMKSGL